ncbi:MAG: succinate dehydrogenase, cytochrome b556 subunit [Elusimicrobiota bacterium]
MTEKIKYFIEYKKHRGFVLWILMRLTGWGLVLYLFLHLNVTRTLITNPEKFDSLMELFQSPVFKLGELLLITGLIIHGLNGIKITIMDLGLPSEKEKVFFIIALIAGIAAFFSAAYPILLHLGR